MKPSLPSEKGVGWRGNGKRPRMNQLPEVLPRGQQKDCRRPRRILQGTYPCNSVGSSSTMVWNSKRSTHDVTPEVLPPEWCQGRCDRFIEFFVGKIRSVKQAGWWSNGSTVSGSRSRWPELRGIGSTLNRWRQEVTGVNSRQVHQHGWYSDVAAQVMRGYFRATHRQTGCSAVPWWYISESIQDRVGHTSPEETRAGQRGFWEL